MLGGAVASTWGVGTAQAQQGPAASPAAGPELQEVIVTGSRIRRVDAETRKSGAGDRQQTIQESGITQVGDLLAAYSEHFRQRDQPERQQRRRFRRVDGRNCAAWTPSAR